MVCTTEKLKEWWEKKEKEIVDEEALRASVIEINEPEFKEERRSGWQHVVHE